MRLRELLVVCVWRQFCFGSDRTAENLMPKLLWVVCALTLVMPLPAAMAYGKEGHYDILNAVALLTGFAPDDAAMIANASWSLDLNDDTTAFSFSKIEAELKQLKGRDLPEQLRDLPHMTSGQVFHAITSPENRRLVEDAHIRRINRALSRARSDPSDGRKKNLALLYLGQYLHFVADEVVHPYDPLFAHAAKGRKPDWISTDPYYRLQIMMHLMREKLQQFQAGEVRRTEPDQLQFLQKRVDTDLARIAQAVAQAWKPTYSGIEEEVSDRYLGIHDERRNVSVAAQVAQVLSTMGHSYTHFSKRIDLDSDGDPVPTAWNQRTFGHVRSIEELPFSVILNQTPELTTERAAAVENVANVAKLQWVLPSSPGGVALSPGLKMPRGIGRAKEITLDEDGLVLITSTGEYRFEGLEPRTLATMLRTVAAGQIPFISIGTEPSDREGYAKVTYAQSLKGTREGAILYWADIQFKAIICDYPFGESYFLKVPSPALIADWPGHGGDFIRFWITSSDIRLKNRVGRLEVERHGMRILSETKLRGEFVRDPEMEGYTEQLTSNWESLATMAPAFRSVQDLALPCALAFWIRKHGVVINPVLLTLPPRFVHTPDYAPIVVSVGHTSSNIGGGVALTPEKKTSRLARIFLFLLTRAMNKAEQGGRSVWFNRVMFGGGGLLAILACVILPGSILWLVGVRLSPDELFGDRANLGYWSMVFIWGGVLIGYFVLTVALSLLTTWSWLPRFDRDFIAFVGTLLAFPILLYTMFWGLAQELTSGRFSFTHAPSMKVAVLVLGVIGPFLTGVAGIGLATLTASVVGPVPSKQLEWVLNKQLAPAEMIGQAMVSGVSKPLEGGRPALVPIPMSLGIELQAPYERTHWLPSPAEEVDVSVDMIWDSSRLPLSTVRRIHWPETMAVDPEVTHYSKTGEPPY